MAVGKCCQIFVLFRRKVQLETEFRLRLTSLKAEREGINAMPSLVLSDKTFNLC